MTGGISVSLFLGGFLCIQLCLSGFFGLGLLARSFNFRLFFCRLLRIQFCLCNLLRFGIGLFPGCLLSVQLCLSGFFGFSFLTGGISVSLFLGVFLGLGVFIAGGVISLLFDRRFCHRDQNRFGGGGWGIYL